ncbi:hypothetical protein [Amycolatopsis thermoflava]|uniref:hypothetical protein n=1 Tax=Amycolatopsis thermoflava TaxID=84480 RepID=UPI00365FFAD7
MPLSGVRNPFQVMMIAAFGVYCAAGLVAFEHVATSTLRGYPEPWGHVFLGASFIACSIALTGTIRAKTVRGVLLERAGLTGLAGVTLAYAAWALSGNGVRSLAFVVLLGAMGAASAWRVAQISAARKAALR